MPEEVQCQEEAQGRHGSSPILVSTCPGGPHTAVGVSVGPGDEEEGGAPKSTPASKSRFEDSRLACASQGQSFTWVQGWPLEHPEDSTGPEQVL